MDEYDYQWPYTSMTQPMQSGVERLNAISALSAQLEVISRRLGVLEAQRTQSVVFCDFCAGNHSSHQCTISNGLVPYGGDYNNYAYPPDNYHQNWGYHPYDTWSLFQQDQSYAPSHMYQQEFLCPPPPQQEENSRLEEVYEEVMRNQAVAIQNLEDQTEKMFKALNDSPQGAWPHDMYSEADGVPVQNLQLDEPQKSDMEEESGDMVNIVGEELYECSNEDVPILLVPQESSPPTFKIPVRFAKPCPLGSHVVGNALFDIRASIDVEPWLVEEEEVEEVEEEPIVFDNFQCPNTMVTNTMEEAPSYLTVEMGNLLTKSKLGDLDFVAITNGNLPNDELLPMDGGFLKYRRGIG